MGFPYAPRQNVQQYVNAPVMSVPAQSQQPQVTMADFLRATQPKQENFFNTTEANPLLHVAGLPQNQPKPQPPSQEELLIQRVSGYNGNTTS
jgi:hypothetical protein